MPISERRDELVKRAQAAMHDAADDYDTSDAECWLIAVCGELCGFLAALELRDPEPTETPDAK